MLRTRALLAQGAHNTYLRCLLHSSDSSFSGSFRTVCCTLMTRLFRGFSLLTSHDGVTRLGSLGCVGFCLPPPLLPPLPLSLEVRDCFCFSIFEVEPPLRGVQQQHPSFRFPLVVGHHQTLLVVVGSAFHQQNQRHNVCTILVGILDSHDVGKKMTAVQVLYPLKALTSKSCVVSSRAASPSTNERHEH